MLDTNIISYIVTGRSKAARAWLSGCREYELACVSAITEAEVRFGLAKRAAVAGRLDGIEALFSRLQVLPWSREEAKVYGTLRSQLESRGKPLGNLDLLIAAHALAVQAVLVTNDKAFSTVPNLGVENWATDL